MTQQQEPDVYAILGVTLVTIGLGLWWIPAGLIWLGLAMIAYGILIGYVTYGRD